jgi:hypothetical protein
MEEAKDIHISPPPAPDGQKTGWSTARKIGVGVGIALGVALVIIVLAFLLAHPGTTRTIRDLFIIVLALETVVIGALLVLLIYQLISLARLLREDVKPLVESTQATLNTVKGTASFVSQRVTQPAVAAASYVAGVSRSVSVLVGMLPRRRPSAPEEPNLSEEAIQPEEAEEGG